MTDYRREIVQVAREFGVDPNLLEALVLTESSGRTDAFRYEPAFYERYLKNNPEYAGEIPRRVSSSYGLCQVMAPVARELGLRKEPEYLFVPTVGLYFGCKKLAECLKWAQGDVDKALGAYNAGKGNALKPRAKQYVAKVRKHLAAVQAEHP